MDESFLLKLSLLFSVLGLFIIFFISKEITINDTTIEKISKGESQESITLKGEISEVTSKEGLTILKIRQENEIEIIAFSDKLDLKPGDFVSIIGKISEYKNKKEILADKIELEN